MTLDFLYEIFGDDRDIRPNKFTRYIGEQIRKARIEASLSQVDLAEMIFKRRATLSDMENGKTEPDASTLAILAMRLDKPLGYFYPPYLYQEIKQEYLTPLENELLIHFQKIWDDHLRKTAIDQVKVISGFNPTETYLDAVDLTISEKENQAKLLELIERRHKKK